MCLQAYMNKFSTPQTVLDAAVHLYFRGHAARIGIGKLCMPSDNDINCQKEV